MPRKPKMQDSEVWAQVQPYFQGRTQMDARELREALELAGEGDLVNRLVDLKNAGYIVGRVDVRERRPVHVYQIKED